MCIVARAVLKAGRRGNMPPFLEAQNLKNGLADDSAFA